MKFVVLLTDISEQLLEITDQISSELLHYSIFNVGYKDDENIAQVRLRKLTIMSVMIYLTITAVRVSEEMDETTERIVTTQIEHVINDTFIRSTDGTPYHVYPIIDYLDEYNLTSADLAIELYDAINDSFLSTETFDSAAYQEIVSYFMDIPDDIDLYDFTLAERFRYRLGANADGRIRGLMVIQVTNDGED